MRWAAAVAVAVVSLVAATPARGEAPGQWSGGGPPAGVVNLLSVDPVDPQIVYGSAFATVYRSRDGAASWEALPLQPGMPNPVGTLAVDPAAHELIYAQAAARPFSVALRDRAGRIAVVSVPRSHPAVLYPVRGLAVLGTIRIPLSAFRGVDLGAIAAVELHFDRSPRGRLLVTDLSFLR